MYVDTFYLQAFIPFLLKIYLFSQIKYYYTQFMAVKNERNTENLVRDQLRKLDYYDSDNSVLVEEQKSHIDSVKRLLKLASKTGKGGSGAPEFIINDPITPDFLLIFECKADNRDHISSALRETIINDSFSEFEQSTKNSQRYAVDGVLHYAQKLSREFNVIGVAVSGETLSSMEVSTFIYTKGSISPKLLKTREGQNIETIIPWKDYIEHGTFDPNVQQIRFKELMTFSRDLHDFMRDHAKLTEGEKPLVVSGSLIALRNKVFGHSYDLYGPDELQKEWMRVIKDEIQKADIPGSKKDNMTQPYSSIAVHPELGKPTKMYPRGILHELIKRLNEKVWPFISVYHDFDVVGQFYGEFLKYTGGDKKALGIVLTPRHVTELFALLSNVDKDSRVLDICAGTGGFLISAMHQMLKSAVTEDERKRVFKEGLVGIEQQPNMFALSASNMILRGDGKANLHQGSCFDDAIIKAIKQHHCTIGMLNPPFSQGDSDLHELYFIKRMLDCLEPGGTGIAICPMSCAIAPHPARAELLKHHTLEAVMSMPDELFYPVGTVTCIMVFTAKVAHSKSNKKTWFAYWKNDGFVKTKPRGRVDLYSTWPEIRDHWVDTFINREVHIGESVLKKVTANDEWCAEAYMETDYSIIDKTRFEEVVQNYAIYQILGGKTPVTTTDQDD
jgi:type I restriction enzyme M protein